MKVTSRKVKSKLLWLRHLFLKTSWSKYGARVKRAKTTKKERNSP